MTWDELRGLAAFRAAKGCAISLYVDLDPSIVPTPGEVAARVNALLDEAGKTERANDGGLDRDARQGLRADIDRLRAYFDGEFDRSGASGVAVFCAGLDSLWTPMPLTQSVPNGVHVGRRFHLSPLVALVGRGEDALVVFATREQGRFYRMRAGRLHEVTDLSDEQPGRHDQGGWSQARYQRHIDKLVGDHLREVAEEIDRRVRAAPGGLVVVIVSPEESRAELASVLSHEVQAAVVAWSQAEAHASAADLEELIRPLLDEARAKAERELAERWREAAGRNGRAAAGWEETLAAASDARVETLLVADGADREAWRCPRCGRANTTSGECPLDGTIMEHVPRGVEAAVGLTLQHGGTVQVFEDAADLGPTEGIGALLRF